MLVKTKKKGYKKPHLREDYFRRCPVSGLYAYIPQTIVRRDLLPYITKDGQVLTIHNIMNNLAYKGEQRCG
jgi:hypothetical protein